MIYTTTQGLLGRIEQLESDNAAMKKLLKEMEWHELEDITLCPRCLAHQWNGHRDDCELAKLINTDRLPAP